jgi:hypothetical protein
MSSRARRWAAPGSRALANVIEPFNGAGCRFFSNDGGQGRGWTELLARIETLHADPHREQAAIDAAVVTFQKFENWMQDWAPDPARDPSCVPALENGIGG